MACHRLPHPAASLQLVSAARGRPPRALRVAFPGTDSDGVTFVFDVYKGEEGWHVHRTYE